MNAICEVFKVDESSVESGKDNSTRVNLYEGMFIIKASLSDEARSKALDRVKGGLTQRGGELIKIHEMGLRRLAYSIDRHKEGVYTLIYFHLPPAHVTEFWQECHLNEDLLRFMTLRTESVLEKLEFAPLVTA